jgi:flavin-dependent dehydrogenase
MGLLESFLAEPHEPWYGNRSVWGGSEPQELDFLRDPDGHGWHLDRRRFEQWLRVAAQARGAELLQSGAVEKLEREGDRWRATVKTPDGPLTIFANLVIDAGGRAAQIARKLGARSQMKDNLVCAWQYGRDQQDSGRGLTYVEAVKDGWWYTAPIPGGRRVLAFHTDADLLLVSQREKQETLLECTRSVRELSGLLSTVGFVADNRPGFAIARSAMLSACAGERWLAVGDAAISFDPLSSQGLLNALFTGLAAAEAAESYLKGDSASLDEYSRVIRGIGDSYQTRLAFHYAAETRWARAPFWQRRTTRY